MIQLGGTHMVNVMRDTRFQFSVGTRVHELTDPRGNVFVLFAYEVIDGLDVPDFQSVDALDGYNADGMGL